MKRSGLRFNILFWVILAAVGLALAGCGGGSNDDYVYSGTVYGVRVTPLDGTTGIDVGEDVYVSWPESSYPEPSTFTFKLERETTSGGWSGVYTQNVGSSVVSGVDVWRFRPVDYLNYYNWYKVTLTDNTGRKQVIMFRSESSSGYASAKAPADFGADKGAVEHTVITKK